MSTKLDVEARTRSPSATANHVPQNVAVTRSSGRGAAA